MLIKAKENKGTQLELAIVTVDETKKPTGIKIRATPHYSR
jgi:hypothetical protein